MLIRVDGAFLQALAGAHRRQALGVFLVGDVVLAFLVEGEEAVELHHRAGGAQVDGAGAGLGGDVDGGALELAGFHLACDRAPPDQLVKLGLVGIEERLGLGRAQVEVGRADRLVRLLGVLGLGHVLARGGRQVALAVVRSDQLAAGGDRLLGDLHAVGSHISNEADGLALDGHALVEPLRDPHGMGGGEAELAAGFLLQGGSSEGRRRVALGGLGLDRGDREGSGLERLLECLRFRASADVEPLDLLAVGADQAGLELVAARGRELGHQRPVFARNEALDLELAVAHQPQRHRLHASGRAGARQLAPQHRRQRKADQIVERTPRQIGIHQGAVDGARMLHGVEHGSLGDGVEHHALDRLRLDRLLLLEHLEHMPGDGLALAVRVGGQDQLVGPFDRPHDLVHVLLGLGVDLPEHVEIVLGIDRAVLGRQVPHMAERGQHLIAAAQILVDRLGLGGQFNDDDIHVIPMSWRQNLLFRSGISRAKSRAEHGETTPRCQIGACAPRPGGRVAGRVRKEPQGFSVASVWVGEVVSRAGQGPIVSIVKNNGLRGVEATADFDHRAHLAASCKVNSVLWRKRHILFSVPCCLGSWMA